jgi:hypothetical protein
MPGNLHSNEKFQSPICRRTVSRSFFALPIVLCSACLRMGTLQPLFGELDSTQRRWGVRKIGKHRPCSSHSRCADNPSKVTPTSCPHCCNKPLRPRNLDTSLASTDLCCTQTLRDVGMRRAATHYSTMQCSRAVDMRLWHEADCEYEKIREDQATAFRAARDAMAADGYFAFQMFRESAHQGGAGEQRRGGPDHSWPINYSQHR